MNKKHPNGDKVHQSGGKRDDDRSSGAWGVLRKYTPQEKLKEIAERLSEDKTLADQVRRNFERENSAADVYKKIYQYIEQEYPDVSPTYAAQVYALILQIVYDVE